MARTAKARGAADTMRRGSMGSTRGAAHGLSMHVLFGLLNRNDHVLRLHQWLAFARPLLTNALSLPDAFAIFLNAAAVAREDALAAAGVGQGPRGDPVPKLSYDAFEIAFRRLAQRRYRGDPDSQAHLLELLEESGVDAIVESAWASDDFLSEYLTAPSVSKISEVGDRLAALFTDDVAGDVQASLRRSLDDIDREALYAETGIEPGELTWERVRSSAATVAWTMAEVRGRLIEDTQPAGAASVDGDGAAAPEPQFADPEELREAFEEVVHSTPVLVEDAHLPVTPLFDADGWGVTLPGPDGSREPRVMLPGYIEWLARLAHRRSQRSIEALVHLRLERNREHGMTASPSPIAVGADTLNKFRKQTASVDAGDPSTLELPDVTVVDVDAVVEASVEDTDVVVGLPQHLERIVSSLPRPVTLTARAVTAERAATGVWHPSLSLQPQFGLVAPSVGVRVGRMAPPKRGESRSREQIGGSPPRLSRVSSSGLQSTGSTSPTRPTSTVRFNLASKPATASRALRPASAPPIRGANTRPASAATTRTDVGPRTGAEHLVEDSRKGAVEGGVATEVAQGLGALAASLRRTPAPFVELGIGIGPQPLRVIDPAKIVKEKKAKGSKKGGNAKAKAPAKKKAAAGGKGGKKGKKGKNAEPAASRLAPDAKLWGADVDRQREIHKAHMASAAVQLRQQDAARLKNPPKQTAPEALRKELTVAERLAAVSPMQLGLGGGARPVKSEQRVLADYYRHPRGPGLRPDVGVASANSPTKYAVSERDTTSIAGGSISRGVSSSDGASAEQQLEHREGRLRAAWAVPDTVAEDLAVASPLRSSGTPFWQNDDDNHRAVRNDDATSPSRSPGSAAGAGGAREHDGEAEVADAGERSLMSVTLTRSKSSRALGLPESATLRRSGPTALLADELGEAGDLLVPTGLPKGAGDVAVHNRPTIMREVAPKLPTGPNSFRPPADVLALLRSARAYHDSGRHDDAVATYQRALAEWQIAYGPEELAPQQHAYVLACEGSVRHSAGDAGGALRVTMEARDVLNASPHGGDSSSEISASVEAALGGLAFHFHRYEMAARCFAASLLVRERELGSEDPDTLSVRHNLGCALLMCGKGDEALVQLRRAAAAFADSPTATLARKDTSARNLLRARSHTSSCNYGGKPLELALRPDRSRLLTDASYTVVTHAPPVSLGKKKKGKKKKKKKKK